MSLFKRTVNSLIADVQARVDALYRISAEKADESDDLQARAAAAKQESIRAARIAAKFNAVIE